MLFNLNLVQNKFENNLLNLLNHFNEFKKYTTDKLQILEKAKYEKNIIIDNLNKKIENLSNELKIKENLLIKKIIYSSILSSNCIKNFIYQKKIIYCIKVDAQIDISNYIDYNKKFNCDWFKPDSSEESNDIIEYFYTNYKLYDISSSCWIITYFFLKSIKKIAFISYIIFNKIYFYIFHI